MCIFFLALVASLMKKGDESTVLFIHLNIGTALLLKTETSFLRNPVPLRFSILLRLGILLSFSAEYTNPMTITQSAICKTVAVFR